MKGGFVYLLTNKRDGVVYCGSTIDLAIRVGQHRLGKVSSFTQRYNCHRLVWFEWFDDLNDAQRFERRMKKWNREWKVKRIEERNPAWDDLTNAIPHLT